jgi:hypothetical protein
MDMVLFALFIGLALAHRAEPQAHKRLMLLASINLMAAAVARWPLGIATIPPVFFGLVDLLFLGPLVVWDLRTLHRLHRVTLWGGLITIGAQALRLWLVGSESWMRFASWLVD